MIKIEKTKVVGIEEAIRGMRNPMNSWEKSDSEWTHVTDVDIPVTVDSTFHVGPNDMGLMRSLASGGPVHAKYRRMIAVYLDITAPLYWWKEFDTYKVGTVANSCSTMHKIHEKEFTLDDFSCEHLLWDHDDKICPREAGIYCETRSSINEDLVWNTFISPVNGLELVVKILNENRKAFLETKDKKYWWQMIQLLPSSYNQKRTVMLNYEVLAGIYKWRKDHRLDEWRAFCDWIEELPYSDIITGKVSYTDVYDFSVEEE